MTNTEWWDNWCAVWWAIGWRQVTARSNYNTEDLLDLIAGLIVRLRRLEARNANSLAGMFGLL